MVETLGEVLPFAARRYGGKTALVSDGRSFTFNELEVSSNAFANGLVAAGIRPGDTVTLYGPNSWQWLVAYYAVAKTGAVVNPVNVMLTPEELKFIVGDCGARAVVASADKAAALMDMKGNTGLSEVVIWGDKAPAGTTPFDRWLEQGKPTFTPATRSAKGHRRHLLHLRHHRPPQGRRAEPALHRRHRQGHGPHALAHQRRHRRQPAARPARLRQLRAQCGHSGRRRPWSAAALQRGGRARCHPDAPRHHVRLRADRLLLPARAPEASRATTSARSRAARSAARRCRCQIAGMDRAHRRAGARALGHDGAGGAATFNPTGATTSPAPSACPCPACPARSSTSRTPTRDAAGRARRADDQGPARHGRLRRRREEHQGDDRPDGWMHTGDIATVDADGYYTIVDRKKDMILTAGYNVYPAELERVLCMHPAVALAAVCGVADEAKGELAKAYVMLKPGASAWARSWSSIAAEHLPPTSSPAPCSSSPACRSRAPARSCAGS